MALDRYQILGAYEYLEAIYNDIVNETNPRKQHFKIEDYSSQLFRIESNMKIIKKFINSTYETEFKDDAVKLYNECEILYYKILFFDELWASTDWIKETLDEYLDKKFLLRDGLSYQIINKFVETLLSGDNPKRYKSEIAKIVAGKMIPKTLSDFFNNVKIRSNNFTSLNESFYNPFDDDLLNDLDDNVIDEPKEITPEEDRIIRKIKLYNNKSKVGGVQFKDDRVYASKTFYMDDIIEVAPVRILDDADLYSSNVRKLTFPIDLSRRIFGIPFGIGSMARSEVETGIHGNIDYEYDPSNKNEIVIYATRKINKGDELVFVNDNKMELSKTFNSNYSHPDEILSIGAKVKTI